MTGRNGGRRMRLWPVVGFAVLALAAGPGCSDGGDGSDEDSDSTTTTRGSRVSFDAALEPICEAAIPELGDGGEVLVGAYEQDLRAARLLYLRTRTSLPDALRESTEETAVGCTSQPAPPQTRTCPDDSEVTVQVTRLVTHDGKLIGTLPDRGDGCPTTTTTTP